MIESKLKITEKVQNKDRRFGSNREYYPCIVIQKDGQEAPALFTEHDIQEAIARAKANPEDVNQQDEKSFWDFLFGGD